MQVKKIILNEKDFKELVSGKEVIKQDSRDSDICGVCNMTDVEIILQDIGFWKMIGIIKEAMTRG